MKALAKMIITITLIFLLFGCATTGLRFSEMKSSLSKLNPDSGRIYIYRKSVFGAAIQPKVFINDEEVGRAVPKGFFYVDREAGKYEIKTSTEVKRTLSLLLENGQVRFVRLNISVGFFVGHVYPKLVENDVGESEIQKLRYIGKK